MFGIWNFGHCDLFVICDLLFEVFHKKLKIVFKALRLNAFALPPLFHTNRRIWRKRGYVRGYSDDRDSRLKHIGREPSAGRTVHHRPGTIMVIEEDAGFP